MNAPTKPTDFDVAGSLPRVVRKTGTQKVAVIGAGITGVTVAYALMKRGMQVTVFDRHRYPAMDTSFANGGQLSACNAEVWNHPSNIAKGIKWMFTKDAPLLFNLTPSWHKYSWVAEFMLAMRNYEPNTVRSAELGILARDNLFAWAADEAIDFNHEKRGILHVYKTQKATEHARKVGKLLDRAGLDRREVTPTEAVELEPTLSGTFAGAFYTPSDTTGDIHKFTVGLAEAAAKKGVRFEQDVEVKQVSASGGITVRYAKAGEQITEPFDQIVVAAGVGSRALAAQLGDRVNVYPVKGYSITVQLNDEAAQNAAPWMNFVDDDAKIVTSRLGADRLRVAGTAEFNGFNRDIRMDRIRPLVEWCNRLFPNMPTEHCVPWAGLRPMMPDMMPRLAPGKAAGVHYHCGHGHLGWTMSCGTAELVAENVLQSASAA
ncbi:MAG: D-amino acid dehydrogenase [Devosiaceae bacterium]|nr:D-amino acid dehydrogenase [Devosiaceae bacterium MH13]